MRLNAWPSSAPRASRLSTSSSPRSRLRLSGGGKVSRLIWRFSGYSRRVEALTRGRTLGPLRECWRARIVYHLCFPIAGGAREERCTTDDSNAEQAIRTFFCQEEGPF